MLQISIRLWEEEIVGLMDCIRSQKLYDVWMLQTTQKRENVLFLLKVSLGVAPRLYLLSNNRDLQCRDKVNVWTQSIFETTLPGLFPLAPNLGMMQAWSFCEPLQSHPPPVLHI